jgi:hypothetical protein
MSLLNDKTIIIETYHTPTVREFPVTEPTSGLAMLHEFSQTNDMWYCMITTGTSLRDVSIVELMGQETYEKIINRTAFLVVDLPFEPFLNCIDSVYENAVQEHGIPSSQIIFMSAMFDSYEYNKKAAVRYNIEPINIFYFSALEYMIHPNAVQYEPPSLEIKPYSKKFLNLNRRWREHRPVSVLLLRYRNLLEKGHVSFGPCENHGNWDAIWDTVCISGIGNSYMEKAIRESVDIKNMPPLLLDTDELHTNRAVLESTTDPYYATSYFSLVSETTFYTKYYYQNSRFITEKTYKPIAMKHPFVLITIPKSLDVLKFLGYKTFSPWIDESYDNEMDDNRRLLMVMDEVERLSNLTDDELAEFITETNKICEYNYNLLKNRTKFVYRMGETCSVI